MPAEGAKLKTITRLYKFKGDRREIYELLRSGAKMEDIIEKCQDALIESKTAEGNMFLTEGINYMWRFLIGETGLTPFNQYNCHIGVGDGTTEESSIQTGLLGTNKCYKSMDGGYPKVSGGSFIVRSTFDANEANFAWNEWTVANGNSDAAINLNRKVQSLGTKSSTEVWVLELVLTIG